MGLYRASTASDQESVLTIRVLKKYVPGNPAFSGVSWCLSSWMITSDGGCWNENFNVVETVSRTSAVCSAVRSGPRATSGRSGTSRQGKFLERHCNRQLGSEAARIIGKGFLLFEGGLRTLTELIAKANPKAYLLEIPAATSGIRATKLDARLCDGDCSTESSEAKKGVAVANTPVVARAALTTGKASATGADGRIRKLTRGGPIDEKDLIETKSRSFAMLAFVEKTKVTLRQKTVFHIEEFSRDPYEESQERGLFKSPSGARTIDSDVPSPNVNIAATSRLSNTTTSGRGTRRDAVVRNRQHFVTDHIRLCWPQRLDRTLGLTLKRFPVHRETDLMIALDPDCVVSGNNSINNFSAGTRRLSGSLVRMPPDPSINAHLSTTATSAP